VNNLMALRNPAKWERESKMKEIPETGKSAALI